jgi:hypothetical protein
MTRLALLTLALLVSPAHAQRLIHHWDFDHDSVLVDLAADSASNGTLMGGARLSNGVLQLDGRTGHVQLAGHFIPSSPPYTVALFARAEPGGSAGGYRHFLSQGAVGAAFYLGSSTDGNLLAAGDNWPEVPGTRFLLDGLWHHYALTMSASEACLYVDGVLVASGAPFAGGAGGTPTRLGRGVASEGAYFGGDLDEVRVYSDVLDAHQVRELAGINRLGTEPGRK